MASSYTGLYVQRLNDGAIHNVQVVDAGGHSIPLNPNEYIARGVQPPIDQLSDLEDYEKGK